MRAVVPCRNFVALVTTHAVLMHSRLDALLGPAPDERSPGAWTAQRDYLMNTNSFLSVRSASSSSNTFV